jgi:hypothetical protein
LTPQPDATLVRVRAQELVQQQEQVLQQLVQQQLVQQQLVQQQLVQQLVSAQQQALL